MQNPGEAIRRVSLENKRAWHIALFLIFLLGLCSRILVHEDLSSKPAGRMQEWFGTEPWFYAELGKTIVERNDWSLAGRNLLVTRDMLRAAPESAWSRWAANKLPRGALGVYVLAVSYGMSSSLALYKLLSMIAGALAGSLCGAAAANIFNNRRVGLLTGVVTASLQSMIIPSLCPGPWIWEALVFSSLLLVYTRLLRDVSNPAEWLLFGVIAGLGIWLRPLFFWAPCLALGGAYFGGLRPKMPCVAALTIPFLVFAVGISTRNLMNDATIGPVVGHQGWDFLVNTNPAALQGPAVPPDIAIMEASRRNFMRAVTVAAGIGSYRKAFPRVEIRKVRELLGARDVASSVSADYIYARSRLLRLVSFTPDNAMSLGWAGLFFLLVVRRLPKTLAVIMGVLLLHGLFFGTSGFDRLLLVLCFTIVGCGAFVIAWDKRAQLPAAPFAFLALWAASHLILQVDDHSRGPRLRAQDFRMAASDYRRSGNEKDFVEELKAADRVRLLEADMEGYWNTER